MLIALITSGCAATRPAESTDTTLEQPTGNQVSNGAGAGTIPATSAPEVEDDFAGFDDLDDEFENGAVTTVSDPLGGYNRAMTTFNDKVYFWVLKPTAQGYKFLVPKFARRGIDNLFSNALFPKRFANNLLQLKFKGIGIETARFTINSTIGLAGLMDPAEAWFDLTAQDEDFGQTLGYWGVGSGPHLVLPFLGPSNLRDTIALPADWFLSPTSYIEQAEHRWGTIVLDKVNATSLRLGEYENLKKDAVDFYPFLRDIYEQNRKKKIEE